MNDTSIFYGWVEFETPEGIFFRAEDRGAGMWSIHTKKDDGAYIHCDIVPCTKNAPDAIYASYLSGTL